LISNHPLNHHCLCDPSKQSSSLPLSAPVLFLRDLWECCPSLIRHPLSIHNPVTSRSFLHLPYLCCLWLSSVPTPHTPHNLSTSFENVIILVSRKSLNFLWKCCYSGLQISLLLSGGRQNVLSPLSFQMYHLSVY